jgi:hypothetical protein
MINQPEAPAGCMANDFASLMYVNCKFSGRDSISFRPE